MLADPRFAPLAPDFSFAWRNMPGMPLGKAALAEGPVNCASQGLRITLTGSTAHASQPEQGVSPMNGLARLLPALAPLGSDAELGPDFAMVTVTHARLGEPAFGVAPGEAEIWATLRTLTSQKMAGLRAAAERIVRAVAQEDGLTLVLEDHDVFPHCENAPQAVERLARAMDAEGVAHDAQNLPMRASEDFGRFRRHGPAAMFLLGAGEDHPGLHTPTYDFPDALIGIGARVMMRTLRDLLG